MSQTPLAPIARLLAFAALSAAVLLAFARGTQTPDVKAIEDQLGKLRSVPDDERGHVTKDLALQIRQLPKSDLKVGLANGLANLSTEGDFGQDTLQEVATTLAQALSESPAPSNTNEPAPPYMELAQLVRFEHVSIALDAPQYKAALAAVDSINEVRKKADFTLTDIGGKTWTLSALRGKVVLVNFWATWCPPCRKEMPDLEALYTRFKGDGFVILAISDEDLTKVKPFVSEKQYDYTILLDPGRKVNELYHVDGIPKSFIYDRQGRLVAQSIDMRTQRQFLEMLGRAGLK